MINNRLLIQINSLTKKQKLLISELQTIYSKLSLDFYNIEDYPKEKRTILLEVMRDQIIRSQIITSYTLINEFLNMSICYYFFGRNKNFIYLWRTKRFKNFNYFILEELYLLQKLRLVEKIIKIPKKIINDIQQLNTIRNGIAHSFFPENLNKSKPIWKGKSIFSLQGIDIFEEDMEKINDFFIKKFEI